MKKSLYFYCIIIILIIFWIQNSDKNNKEKKKSKFIKLFDTFKIPIIFLCIFLYLSVNKDNSNMKNLNGGNLNDLFIEPANF